MFHDMFHLLLEKRRVCESGRVAHLTAQSGWGFSLMGDTAAQLYNPYHPDMQRICSFYNFPVWSWYSSIPTWLVYSILRVFFFPWVSLFGWLFLSGKFFIHLDFLLFSHCSESGCVEGYLWTCGDGGGGGDRGVFGARTGWLDSPGLCFMLAGLVWSASCTGVCKTCLACWVLCWDLALIFMSWLFACRGQSPCMWQSPGPDPRPLPGPWLSGHLWVPSSGNEEMCIALAHSVPTMKR